MGLNIPRLIVATTYIHTMYIQGDPKVPPNFSFDSIEKIRGFFWITLYNVFAIIYDHHFYV